MTDIFLSYARVDNSANPEITNEATAVVDHFLNLFNHVRQQAGRQQGQVFFDQTMRAGESIPERIRQAVHDCSAMIAFYSPSYFQSGYCLEEYREFKRSQPGNSSAGQADKLLIPVEVHPVRLEELPNGQDPEIRAWVTELVGGGGLKRLVHADALRSHDTRELMTSLRGLEQQLYGHLRNRHGTAEDLRQRTNVFALESKVAGDSLDDDDIQKELDLFHKVRKFPGVPPVLVLYTGGTVGMVHETDSEPLHGDFRIASSVQEMIEYIKPRLSSLPFDVVLLGMQKTIDSSNVAAADWSRVAHILSGEMQRYQGFVVLHGTNTLAYTASALSFLLEKCISKPVVLTGAEVPLSVENTDAINNIENSIRAAGWQAVHGPVPVPEVCVYWNTQLLRGNRTTKMHASDRASSFHTPNLATPLAVLENERLRVDAEMVWRIEPAPARTAPRIIELSDASIDIAFVHPQMNVRALESAYGDAYRGKLDGLILLSYGPGNVPDEPAFTSFIKKLIGNGTTVCNVTQCPYGRVELKLFETNAVLFDMGVIDGYDLTTEAAYGKLLWAIAKNKHFRTDRMQQIKADFQRCLAGEMSATIEDIAFGSGRDFGERGGYLLSQPKALQAGSKYAVIDAFLRLEDIWVDPTKKSTRIRVFMEDRDPTTGTEESVIAEFERTFTPADRDLGTFSKNLQVTSGFRKWYPGGEAQLLLTTAEGGSLDFKSMRLVVYSRPRRP